MKEVICITLITTLCIGTIHCLHSLLMDCEASIEKQYKTVWGTTCTVIKVDNLEFIIHEQNFKLSDVKKSYSGDYFLNGEKLKKYHRM